MNTDDISSTIPYLKNLNVQAKKLVNNLEPKLNFNNKSLVLFHENDNFDMYKLFEKSTQSNNNNNNFSETSPFISSDVYNQLLDNLKQRGGAKKSKKPSKSSKKHIKSESESESYKPRNEDRDEEESSTSSESSSENTFDSNSENTIEKHFKKTKKEQEKEDIDLEPEHDDDEFSPMSMGSYVSSSAHSDGVSSAISSDNDSDDALTLNSPVSVNHKNKHTYSDSVNTSDINIISVDE